MALTLSKFDWQQRPKQYTRQNNNLIDGPICFSALHGYVKRKKIIILSYTRFSCMKKTSAGAFRFGSYKWKNCLNFFRIGFEVVMLRVEWLWDFLVESTSRRSKTKLLTFNLLTCVPAEHWRNIVDSEKDYIIKEKSF